MATINAAKMEEEFRHLQARLSARLSRTALSRITWILAFVGMMLICYTLFNIPNIHGGLPLPLNHGYLISFAVGSGIGILLHFLSLFLHLLAYINEGNLNKSQPQPPSVELIGKCFYRQRKLIITLQLIEMLISHCGSLCQIYVFMLALPAILVPNVDPNSYKANCFNQIGGSSSILYVLYLALGVPTHWILD